jgi:RNA polymerase sigma-70 factor (ECF subfamily)
MVHRMLKRTFGPAQDVDDMVQDVFMCLFRKVGGLREPKSLKAFVISITAMTIKYELRQRRVRRWIHLSGAVSDLEGPRTEQPDPSTRQALMSFYAILDRLNARDRAAFVLRFFEGLELTQVADALGISVSTTKRHLSRIWKRVILLVQRTPELASYLPTLSLAAGSSDAARAAVSRLDDLESSSDATDTIEITDTEDETVIGVKDRI